MEGKLIDELLSVMVEYLSRHIVYQDGRGVADLRLIQTLSAQIKCRVQRHNFDVYDWIRASQIS